MSDRVFSETTRLRLRVAAFAVLAVASATGCSKSDDDDGSPPTTVATPPVAPAPAPTSDGTTPTSAAPGTPSNRSGNSDGNASDGGEGTYFAEVTANGTGCPPKSWEKEISRDQRSFTITFSAYDAKVDDATSVSIKDCILMLKIKSRKPVAYAVQQFSIEGYGQLEEGVSAKLMAGYYFQGNPTNKPTEVKELVGPSDKEYSFVQNVPLPEQVWSQCGLARDLNVETRVRLLRTAPSKKGHVNVAQAKGKAKVFVQLSEKPCP